MNSGNRSLTDLEQIQPIYLAQAQVFIFDSDETKQWEPLGELVVPISILYDATRGIYRIISVDADCQKVIINSTVFPDLEFHKTSQKFGHWTDQSTGTIYGIGFASEYEHNSFFDCLTKVRAAVIGLLKEPSFTENTTPIPTFENGSGRQANNFHPTQLPQHQGQGEGSNELFQAAPSASPTSQRCVLPSWTNYEHLGLNLAGLLDQANKTHAEMPPVPNRQATFRVADSPLTSPRIEELKVKAPMYKPPMQFLVGQNGGPQTSARRQETSLDTINRTTGTVNTNPHPQGLNSQNRGGDHSAEEGRGFIEEIHRLKSENLKLKEALIDSSSNVKKWEVQLDTLRIDNAELVKTMNELTLKIDELKIEACGYKEQCHRWKDHVTNNCTRSQNVKDLEEKVLKLNIDKTLLETKIKNLEDNARLQQSHGSVGSLGSTMSSVSMISSKQAEEMEEYYKNLLSETQKQLDVALASNRGGEIAVHRINDILCRKIHELVTLHHELRQVYSQDIPINSKVSKSNKS